MSKLNPSLKPTPKVDTGSRLAGGSGAFAATQSNERVTSRVQQLIWVQ